MGLFRKKKTNKTDIIVTSEEMGQIIYALASTRTDEFYNYCCGMPFKFNPVLLLSYSMIYNFFFIKQTLSKKYSEELSDHIIDVALESFYARIGELFNKNLAESTKSITIITMLDLDMFFYENRRIQSNEWLDSLSKTFLDNICVDKEFLYDSSLVLDVSIELTSWMKNEYLIREYMIK